MINFKMDSININYCNNIVKANITIKQSALNIKYGLNGTGKSTISKAIKYRSNGDNVGLASLKPYVTESEKDIPFVGDIPYTNVMVFNEDYAKDYIFKTDGIFDDSFRVFLKSDECELLSNEIGEMLYELKNTLLKNTTIDELIDLLNQYVSAVGYSDGCISKRGGIGEFTKGNGAGFDKHEDLIGYKPFYTGKNITDVSKWAGWRTQGIDHMAGNTCPFCACTYDVSTINNQNTIIKSVFKNSALKTAGIIIDYLKSGIEKGYINPDTEKKLEAYIGDSGKSVEICSFLEKLAIETYYLQDKLKKIKDFAPMNVTKEELNNIENKLKEMEIVPEEINKFYSTSSIQTLINLLNQRINKLLLNTNDLKKLFLILEDKLEKLINSRMEDINYFFTIAGFPYEFKIVKNGENKANSCLVPIGTQENVSEPQKHLSWGEVNAFSLVMFMFDAISKNADLIVLDDPISSFDVNKKFAVIKRMYDKQEVTFRGKTVLMLTHDLQPIIDYVHGNFFTSDNVPVYANYIENEKGKINEIVIESEDLLNIVTLTKNIAESDDQSLHVRIINLRKYVELTQIQYSDNEIYEILSNLVHGRKEPKYRNGDIIPDTVKIKAMTEVSLYIKGYNTYEDIINELSTDKLMKEINDGDIYKKIIAIRFIFERCKGLLKQLRKEHPGACKLLNETNHIENDYVYQLNPFKFYSIPEVYICEIKDFLCKHETEIYKY